MSSFLARARTVAPPALLSLALTGGCADGTSGALEQAAAAVDCSPADAACAERGLDRPIAVGASVTIDVSMTAPGSAAPPLGLLSADPAVLTVDGRSALAASEGFAALLFVDDGGEVVDFVHVYTRTADALGIASPDAAGGDAREVLMRTQLLAGDELPLIAQPRRGDQPLGGAFEATWTAVESPEEGSDAVVTLLETGFAGERRLVARDPGQAEIVVQALGLEARIVIEVLP